jgi:hypothetical protein
MNVEETEGTNDYADEDQQKSDRPNEELRTSCDVVERQQRREYEAEEMTLLGAATRQRLMKTQRTENTQCTWPFS